MNKNGVKDASDTAIPNVTVKLTGTDTTGSAVSLTTTTDTTGAYHFTSLKAGVYSITEIQPAGYSEGTNTQGTPGGGTIVGDTIGSITLNAGVDGQNNNFGEVVGSVGDFNLHNSSLCGFVYCDQNNNGIKDSADEAIAGVTVTLTGTEASGTLVHLVTTTDSTGAYQFLNLNKGVYTITETQPTDHLQGKITQGTPGNGTVSGASIESITLNAGVKGQNNNFGELDKPVSLTKLQLLGIHHQQTTICLKFDGALNPASAQNTANYTLIALGKDQRLGSATNRRVRIISAVYDSKENTVILTPENHLNIHYHYLLTTKITPADSCSPAINTVNVFGRAAVPYFTIHGVQEPAKPMLAWEIQRDHQVVNNALAAYAKHPNLTVQATSRRKSR